VDVVVCGAKVPFTRGGAELLMENLVAAIRAAGHRADLVQIPVGWAKDRLFDSAMAWRLAPVGADLVIATNFPSYFVDHPSKVVWLLHQHRGAYDLVDAAWSDIGTDSASVEVQRQLTEWDSRALSEAQRVFTISDVVTDRLARFNGLAATTLYHPPPLFDRLHAGPFGDYVLLPSRLAANKRPDLLVEALAHVPPGTRAVLAGEGPLRDDLVARATALGVTGRLELAGFVSDERLVELFAGALAVVYPPVDEDYGYVTLQAFAAGKPVITCDDSGGVLEWVVDGESGFVTDGTPEAMGAAIAGLAADPGRAAEMGQKGRAKVGDLSWGPVVDALLGTPGG
jgi:glycosyltransferase involved in cell wall biosynthesis